MEIGTSGRWGEGMKRSRIRRSTYLRRRPRHLGFDIEAKILDQVWRPG